MIPSEMMAVAIAAPGGPEALQAVRAAVPEPADDEVLIRVAAAGVNGPDLSQRRGSYDPPPGHSPVPGLEVAGVVVGRGEKVAGITLGESVVALCNGGGYAEYVAVPAGQVLPLPQGWSMPAGAALPETFFTIQQTLVMRAGLTADMVVLVHGGAGGIGGAAIGMARLHHARPIAVVSNAEKAAYALALGADAIVDTSQEDFVERVGTLTDGRGADRIIEMMGGEVLARNVAVAARGGHIVVLAALAGARSELNLPLFFAKQLTLSGSTLRPQTGATKAAIATALRETVWPALEDGRIHMPRLSTFRMEEAAEAHRRLEDRASYGKYVLITPFGETLQ